MTLPPAVRRGSGRAPRSRGRSSDQRGTWRSVGERGVVRVADILTIEIRRTMALLGVTSADALAPEHVHLRNQAHLRP